MPGTTGDESAFPLSHDGMYALGLTKREFMAAVIVAGIAAGGDVHDPHWGAGRAVQYADALLQELGK